MANIKLDLRVVTRCVTTCVIIGIVCSAIRNNRFSPAEVAEERFESQSLTTEIVTVIQTVGCKQCYVANLCGGLSWCTLFCEEGQTTYTMTNMLVLPLRVEFLTGTKKKCWSMHSITEKITLAQGGVTIVNATETNDEFPKRKPTNLLDSVYDWDSKSCYYTMNDTKPFVLFDMGGTVTINQVTIVAQNSLNAKNSFRYI